MIGKPRIKLKVPAVRWAKQTQETLARVAKWVSENLPPKEGLK